MDISAISTKVKIPAFAKKPMAKLAKHSPEIMMVVGAGMVIGAAVNACRNTIKANDILKSAENDIYDIDEFFASEDQGAYTAEMAAHDKRIVYLESAKQLAIAYGPSVIFGATGFAMMFGAHHILKSRNAALSIAYSNAIAAYNAYRERVIEAIGEEKEFKLRSGYSKQDVDYIDESGNEKHQKNAKVVDDGSGHSIYARIFDETCASWSRNPSSNLTFLRAQQNYANDKLRSEGVLFLNDVYQMLGFSRTPEGQIVGWVYDPSKKDIDSYVDFGIYDKIFKSSEKRDFINGHEPCIWLDFNVDGVVYDLL